MAWMRKRYFLKGRIEKYDDTLYEILVKNMKSFCTRNKDFRNDILETYMINTLILKIYLIIRMKNMKFVMTTTNYVNYCQVFVFHHNVESIDL